MMNLFGGETAQSARARQAGEREPVWARWRYDADEWRWFDEQEWRRAQNRIRLFLLLEVLSVIVMSVIFGVLIGIPDTPAIIRIFFVLLLIWSLGFTAFWIWRSYRQSRTLHLARQQGPPEIQIGPLGITQPGGIIPLVGAPLRLGSIGTDPFSPPMHTLRQVQVERTDRLWLRFDGWGGRNWPRTVRVPVPRGYEDEAAVLARRFQQEILMQP